MDRADTNETIEMTGKAKLDTKIMAIINIKEIKMEMDTKTKKDKGMKRKRHT